MASGFIYLLAFALASGAPDTSGAQSKARGEDPASRLIDQYYDQMYAERFDKALSVAKDIKPDKDNPQGQAVAYELRAAALLGLKRDGEARNLIQRADELAPQSPGPARTLFFSTLLAQRFDFAADTIDKLLARYPDEVLDIDRDLISFFLRNEPKGQDKRNDDRRVALARIGYGGDLRGDYFAARGVNILLERGDTAGAMALLPRIDDPELIENMLIQKRYSALWPRLGELSGPHLTKVRASNVAAAEHALSEKPEDHELLQGYANALRDAGRIDDAIALRSKLPETQADMGSADEQMGWAVNNVALAFAHARRIDEADRLFEALNHAQIKDGGWRVSMIINRLEVLVSSGRFDKAATLLVETEASAKNDGSDYARQLVRRLQYCTLSRLGKKDEAAKVRPAMLEHAKDAFEPTISGLLCAGDTDEAERMALRALSDPTMDKADRSSFEEDFVHALQPVALTSDDPSVWDNAWRALRQRPAIAKEYERLGRDLPEELLPPK